MSAVRPPRQKWTLDQTDLVRDLVRAEGASYGNHFDLSIARKRTPRHDVSIQQGTSTRMSTR